MGRKSRGWINSRSGSLTAAISSPVGAWLISAEPVDRCDAAEAVVRSFPVVEVPPLGQPGAELGIAEIDRRPEFLQRRPLHALDLAVEMDTRKNLPMGVSL